ncbi:MAG: L-serine ammonia-lyase [Acidobacteriota bacterium]|nr:L-serine ammonia-lyase [Acidobacteriota bacterium]
MVTSVSLVEDTVAIKPVSVTDVFSIGIGPSSSHTVGPMRAAQQFAADIASEGFTPTSVLVELFGSLALTGQGHRTDAGILLGLAGWRPDQIDPDAIDGLLQQIRTSHQLLLAGSIAIPFQESEHLIFHRSAFLPRHPNGMRFTAYHCMHPLVTRQYYSVGGGAILQDDEPPATSSAQPRLRYPFFSAESLLSIGQRYGLTIADIMLANDSAWRPAEETLAFLDEVRIRMFACIDRGCQQSGILPGGLLVRRRAKSLRQSLLEDTSGGDESRVLDWLSLYALAVNEENAAGGRVVTAPTNGAAGVIPAVLRYYETFCPEARIEGSRIFLLTAAAIGALYKMRASISAAEMGCQGEVGVACSMAAAGLAAALGGTNQQIENAAEIGMEHNLGLTCDPIKGLVQVPCIERNTMGAVKAVNAARLALRGDGRHVVSLDAVIETMRQTGNDMRSKYKETSLGGLAVNFVEC